MFLKLFTSEIESVDEINLDIRQAEESLVKMTSKGLTFGDDFSDLLELSRIRTGCKFDCENDNKTINLSFRPEVINLAKQTPHHFGGSEDDFI